MTDPTARSWRISYLAISLIRTGVPVAAGAVLAWLAARYDIVIDERTSAQAMPWIVAGVIAGYYWSARQLERVRGTRWSPRAARWLGRWMLGGVIRVPVYPTPDAQVHEIRGDGTTERLR